MIQLGRIEDSEETDLDKTDKSKECKICHCNYFDDGSKSDSKICNRCDWRIKPFGNFTIIHVNDFSYRFFMLDITEEDLIEFIKDFELDDEFETLLRYERIDISERIDKNKTSLSRECLLCHYWYFKDLEFKFKSNICIECNIGCNLSETNNIAILNIKGVDYRCALQAIGKNKAVSILNHSVLGDKGVIILKNSESEDKDLLQMDFGAFFLIEW